MTEVPSSSTSTHDGHNTLVFRLNCLSVIAISIFFQYIRASTTFARQLSSRFTAKTKPIAAVLPNKVPSKPRQRQHTQPEPFISRPQSHPPIPPLEGSKKSSAKSHNRSQSGAPTCSSVSSAGTRDYTGRPTRRRLEGVDVLAVVDREREREAPSGAGARPACLVRGCVPLAARASTEAERAFPRRAARASFPGPGGAPGVGNAGARAFPCRAARR